MAPWGGSAPNETYTRSDGTRTGTAVCAQAKAAAVNDTAVLADNRENDLAAAINLTLKRDGGNAPTADLPMNSHKLTGLSSGSAAADSISLGQVQNSAVTYAEAGGTANAITLTTSPTCTPVEGMVIGFFAEADNSAATTVALNGGSALALQVGGAACVGGEVQNTQYHEVAFDGTQWQLANPLGANWANVTAFAGVTGASGKVFVFSAAGAGALVDRTDLGLPATTVSVFNQTSAPTGWTKDTTNNNNSAFRLVTGAVGTGGSVAFTTAFASQTPAGTVGDTALSIAQMPAHTHDANPLGDNNNDNAGPPCGSNGSPVGATYNTTSAGSGATHTHTFTGNAINLAVAYVDLIRATKA